jgi:hypothetical protein
MKALIHCVGAVARRSAGDGKPSVWIRRGESIPAPSIAQHITFTTLGTIQTKIPAKSTEKSASLAGMATRLGGG